MSRPVGGQSRRRPARQGPADQRNGLAREPRHLRGEGSFIALFASLAKVKPDLSSLAVEDCILTPG